MWDMHLDQSRRKGYLWSLWNSSTLNCICRGKIRVLSLKGERTGRAQEERVRGLNPKVIRRRKATIVGGTIKNRKRIGREA